MPYNRHITQRLSYEERKANRLLDASDEEIRSITAKALHEKNSEFATFLITIRDSIVKRGKSGIRSELLEINDKVKEKRLLTQNEVDLLQSYNLKCRQNMNVEGRTFSTLLDCDFTGAQTRGIVVRGGGVLRCTFNNLIETNITGYVSENNISGDFLNNIVSGNVSRNTISMSVRKNTIFGSLEKNRIGFGCEENKVYGSININKIDGSMLNNTVGGDIYNNNCFGSIRNNTVTGDITNNSAVVGISHNTYKEAKSNKFNGTTDLTDPSNSILTLEERGAIFGK